jgi:cell division protein FtsB
MTDDIANRRGRHRPARPKRPRRILGLWARVILLAAVIAVSLFLAVCVVLKAVKPYQEASRQRTQLAETLHQSGTLAAENTELERRIAYLKTSDGVASEARRMGYLRPGEYPIVVEGIPEHSDSSETQPETTPYAPMHPATSPMRRFWRHLSGH